MNSACTKIKAEVDKLGVLNRDFISSNNTVVSNPKKYAITALDVKVMAACLESRTSSTEGVPFYNIVQNIQADELKLRISSIKLQKMGLVEIELYREEHGNHIEEYYGHKITELGIDYLLDNEDKFDVESKPSKANIPATTSADFDEEVPF